MKKLVVLTLICFCFSPVYAQRGSHPHRSSRRMHSNYTLRQKVKKKARPTRTHTSEQLQRTRLLNFNGQPVVTFQMPTTKHLRAQLIEPDILRNIVFSPEHTYVPQSFAEEEPALYRGMKFSEITDLETLLTCGLKMEKSSYVGEIFTSPSVNIAVNYALPVLWDTWNGEVQMDLPVLVRIPVTPALIKINAPDQFGFQWIFRRDVPANMISDVMVILRVNDTPGWYKVVRENGQLIFQPVPGTLIPLEDGW